MKIGGLLLALFVILLSIIPCCSLEGCEEEAEEKHSRQEIPGGCEDSCSPFLNCNGCTGFTIQEIPQETTLPLNIPLGKIASYHRQWFPGGIVKAIWQPPQLS